MRLARTHALILAFVLPAALLIAACSRKAEQPVAEQPPAQPTPEAPLPAAPATYEGTYDVTNCNGIMAWAWDTSRPDEPIRVDVYDGGVRIATVAAGDFREDLRAAGKGNGKHSLTLPTPASVKDGKPHKIIIKFAGTSQELVNGPRELTCNPE